MEPYIKFNKEKILKFTSKERYLFMKKWINNRKNVTAIDLGCGQGTSTIALSHFFTTIYGIDPSEQMLKYARNLKKKLSKETGYNNINSVHFYKGHFLNIPIKKVDMIFMFNSLHYSLYNKLFKFNEILDNIFNHINKNGLLYIREPYDTTSLAIQITDKALIKEKNQVLKKTRELLDKYIELNKNKIEVMEKLDKFYLKILKKIK